MATYSVERRNSEGSVSGTSVFSAANFAVTREGVLFNDANGRNVNFFPAGTFGRIEELVGSEVQSGPQLLTEQRV